MESRGKSKGKNLDSTSHSKQLFRGETETRHRPGATSSGMRLGYAAIATGTGIPQARSLDSRCTYPDRAFLILFVNVSTSILLCISSRIMITTFGRKKCVIRGDNDNPRTDRVKPRRICHPYRILYIYVCLYVCMHACVR